MPETRYIDPLTGGEKGQKEARLGGADPMALSELAKVYGMGEQKYARYNYLRGYPWSLSVDALYRHLLAFLGGEEYDPESGLLHTAHVAWHALTLTSFQMRGVGTDDRPPLVPHSDDSDAWEGYSVADAAAEEAAVTGVSLEEAWRRELEKRKPITLRDGDGVKCDHGAPLSWECGACAGDSYEVATEPWGTGDGPCIECRDGGR
jgi:hypothetical protein